MMCFTFCNARSLRSWSSSAKAEYVAGSKNSATAAAKAARQDISSMIAPPDSVINRVDAARAREVWPPYVMIKRRIDDGLAAATGMASGSVRGRITV
ncbi:MAG TPA: hypothetical protein VKE26_25120, partial [Xanthobacteraceae bacterium]|nr:hypothetical protein [Xanthobacteraceae bacterium]